MSVNGILTRQLTEPTYKRVGGVKSQICSDSLSSAYTKYNTGETTNIQDII